MSNKVRKAAFEDLKKHRKRLSGTTMRELFAHDPERFATYSARFGDILLDYSKNRIDSQSMTAPFDLAREVDVEGRRDEMWAGQPINVTEHRSVLHMALRYFGDEPVLVEGEDVMAGVRDVLARIKGFSEAVRGGDVRGARGDQFTDIVNIGIGGSDLGPAMVTLALEPYMRADLRAH